MKSITVDSIVRVSFVALLISGCSPEEPARTVSWYREHPEDRKAMLGRCTDDPGRLGQTPNCVNASQAEGQESIGHWKDLPPLDLPVPKRQGDDDQPKVRP